jgi:predicted ester cyclase
MTSETSRPEAANLFRRVIEEGFNRGNFDAWDECFAERYAEHQYGHPSSLAEFKRTVGGLRHAFPDLHLTIDELITRDDKVWARMTARGTHLGPFMGFAPTAKPFTIAVFDVCRVEHGRIVEHWGVPDRFALLRQLGLLQPPSAPAAA